MRTVRLMPTAPRRKRRSPWIRMLTDSQWRQRYEFTFRWYQKRAAQIKVERYQKWAVFTVLPEDVEEWRMAA